MRGDVACWAEIGQTSSGETAYMLVWPPRISSLKVGLVKLIASASCCSLLAMVRAQGLGDCGELFILLQLNDAVAGQRFRTAKQVLPPWC